MRIIAGNYRGRVLKSPSGDKTRPTSDRLRETLFNVLQTRLDDETRFLDLCAGTGAVGIEALSRGARFATFVDKSRRACALIESNLDLVGVPDDESEVVLSAAVDYLRRKAEKSDGWDIIFFDPPYAEDYSAVLNLVAEDNGILAGDGLFIAEHSAKRQLPDAVAELRRWRVLKQGDTNLSFYEKA